MVKMRGLRNASEIAIAALAIGAAYIAFGNPEHLFDQGPSHSGGGADLSKYEQKVSALAVAGQSQGNAWRSIALDALAAGSESAPALLEEAARRQTAEGERLMLLGAAAEARVAASNGLVEEKARVLFERILLANANDLGALYYLGLEADQRNDLERRASYWQRFLSAASPTHPLYQSVRNQVGRADISFPTERQPNRANDLEFSGETRALAAAMVDNLARRLEAQGGASEEWLLLARSYRRLGDKAAARAAYDKAVSVDPSRQAIVWERDAFIQELR